MRLLKSGFVALACLWLAACAPFSQRLGAPLRGPVAATDHLTVMVSLDGFRPDYLTRGLTPNLNAIAAEGVRAQSVKPSFPTITFPNHYTLVTGLRPDHHGVIANLMDDPVLGHFDKSSDDPRWWNGGLPLWVSAEQAGIKSGSVFWPGSFAQIHGVRPSYWLPFKKTTAGERVDQALAWLDQPADRRPGFLTVYLDEADVAGHTYGPAGAEQDKAIAALDAAIGKLIDGLKRRGRWGDTDLVVVSDHGMEPIDKGRAVYVEDVIAPSIARAVSPSPFTEFRPAPGKEAAAEAILLGAHANYQCWRKGELPARFDYGKNPRVAPIVCLSGPNSEFRRKGVTPGGGDHGFDPADPNMQAFMVARGPSFRHGVVLAPIDNVDIYPMMAKVLGVAPAPNDGVAAHTAEALK